MTIQYRPEIDGLRAVAIIPVIMFHLGSGFSGGFIGVDIFFVISGFLITSIIHRDIVNGSFSLSDFWERRIRRIFPALFVVTGSTLAVGFWLLLPSDLVDLGESSFAQICFAANIYFWRDTGYFSGPAEFKPLLNMWSLAVEEQFYLFLPPALLFLRKTSKTRLFLAIALVASISFFGSCYGAINHTGATFFLLPTRAWELLMGSLLAVLPWSFACTPRISSVLASVGILSITLPMFMYDSTTIFPGFLALPPVLGTALIILSTAAERQLWLTRLLSFQPLVFIGRISYSLYLWHWPVIVYLRLYCGEFSGTHKAFALICFSLLATASWKFIENPFRNRKLFGNRNHLFKTTTGLLGLIGIISLWFQISGGCSWRFDERFLLLQEDVDWVGREYERPKWLKGTMRLSDLPTLGKEVNQQGVDFIVIGDSHAMVMGKCIDSIANDLGLIGKSAAASNTTPLSFASHHVDSKDELRLKDELLQVLREVKPKNLVLIAYWGNLHNLKLKSPRFSGDTDFLIQHGLKHWTQICAELGIKLWIVKQVPMTKEPSAAKNLLQYSSGRSPRLSDQRGTLAEHSKKQERIEKVFQSLLHDRLEFIDPAVRLIDSDGNTINYHDGRALYIDRHHLTASGAEHIRPVLEVMFKRMQKNTVVN